MVRYEDIRDSTEKLVKAINASLKKIAFEHFESDRGVAVRSVLPDKSSEYEFSTENFEGHVHPDTRRFHNPAYNGRAITVNNLVAYPEKFEGLGGDLENLWVNTFGENSKIRKQPNHPGEPIMSGDQIRESLNSINEKKQIVASDPMLDDFVSAIEDKNYRISSQFLNLDADPVELFTPGGTHEMTDLFTQGDISVVYRDRDIALLKPEYNHEIRQEVLNQRQRWGRVVMRGEQPELAFVVGIDDTPTGLFVHSVDGTRLDPDQNVSREYIHDVMGFDYNYEGESVKNMSPGERMRLQGDLAVEMLDDNEPADTPGRSNLPIDNHLVMLNHGQLPESESKESEPINVRIPSLATVNVMHDEHENVSTELPSGTYRFYLLDRGIMPQETRPIWPEP